MARSPWTITGIALAAGSALDLARQKSGWGLVGLAASVPVFLYGRHREQQAAQEESYDGPQVVENLVSDYNQLGSRVRIYEVVHSHEGTIGYKAYVNAVGFAAESPRFDTMTEASDWATEQAERGA